MFETEIYDKLKTKKDFDAQLWLHTTSTFTLFKSQL